jgi:kynureninase
MNFENTSDYAQQLDEKDILKEFRSEFYIPQHEGKDCIYLVGNSLGLQPRSAAAYVQQELDDWAKLGVEGHFNAKNPWKPYHEIFTKQVASIVGALPEEVVVMNQLTVNLHLLMVSFYRPTKKRFKIICEAKAFPSDQYAFESQAKYHGFDPAEAVIEVSPRHGEHTLRTTDILEVIKQHGDSVALVMFGGVNYYTGQLFDIPAITNAAHSVGAYAGFDLAHAAGNVKLELHDWNVDLACWCSYKYLNSGPGGVSGVFINKKHATDTSIPRFAGWWGNAKETRFKMLKGFDAIPSAEGWQLSNAPVLSMSVHKASLDIFERAGMERLIAKGKLLSSYLYFVLTSINKEKGATVLNIITPEEETQRGQQVSILMEEKGREVFDELTKKGVVADWREPNVIRVAAVPLYNTFADVWKFGNIIRSIVAK